MQAPIITLITDWGNRDFFAGMLKGKLYSQITNVRIVDITHNVEPYNIREATIVAQNACMNYPQGTIHIIDVNSIEDKDTPFVVVLYKEQYYICTDNGLPYAVFGNDFSRAVVINTFHKSEFFTFAAYDLFCPVAAQLALGADLADFGPLTDTLYQITPLNSFVMNDTLKIYVSYIDNYGNADLNITYEEFERYRKGRKFSLYIHENTVKEIRRSYFDVDANGGHLSSLLLTVSATGHLQVALREASAEQLLGLQIMDALFVKFSD